MSGIWIDKKVPEHPHYHKLPLLDELYNVEDGSVYECDCGTRFVLVTEVEYGKVLGIFPYRHEAQYWASNSPHFQKILVEPGPNYDRLD